MALKEGEKAPEFTLHSLTPEDKDISLSDYKGKNLVLLFFPQAFTGGCTKEMCTMRDNMSAYNNLGAELLGVSVDGTFVQKAFAEKNNITYPLASDFNKEVAKKYDVLRSEFIHGMKNVSERAVYVIDKDGVIRYSEVTPTPGDMPQFDNVKKAVENLK